MILLVTGGRDFSDAPLLERTLNELTAPVPLNRLILVVGDCPTGADKLAELWASKRVGVTLRRHHADWDKHGKAAGPLRNHMMVRDALDLARERNEKPHCLGFWDGESSGTRNTLELAMDHGFKLRTIRY